MPGNLRPRTVTPRPLAGLAALVHATTAADPLISGVTHASGDVRAGDLYAALPGARRHGGEFVPDAARAGAVAVLTDAAGVAAADAAGLPAIVVDQPREALGPIASAVYGDPTEHLTVIGITGTAGKTSTAYLAESGLRAAGHVTGLIGTVETRLGDLVVDSVRTTPEATDLHALLAVARERGVTAVVMEVSSHALAMGRVGGVRFDVGGYTNFGLDHLDFHADAADYFAAKAKLFDGRCRVEILNLDDTALAPLMKPATVTYSAAGSPAATWRASSVAGSSYSQLFTAIGPGGPVEAGVSLPGRHNIANALLAIAALVATGADPATAARGVAACSGVPGRLERVWPSGAVEIRSEERSDEDGSRRHPRAGASGASANQQSAGAVLGVVDYAHKPDAIVAALAALRELATDRGGRLFCVIGAGGDRDKAKRPLMGRAAAEGADVVVVTDDNPRTEDPAAIRRGLLGGVTTGAEVFEIAGRRAAIDFAVGKAAPGDIVAVLGKGHERGQEVGGEVLPFDDRVELAAALAEVDK